MPRYAAPRSPRPGLGEGEKGKGVAHVEPHVMGRCWPCLLRAGAGRQRGHTSCFAELGSRQCPGDAEPEPGTRSVHAGRSSSAAGAGSCSADRWGKSGRLEKPYPEVGMSMKRKMKGVLQDVPFILAGPVNKLLFYGEGCCVVLGFLLRLEWEKGVRKGKPEHAHPGVCRIPCTWEARSLAWGCSHGAGAVWEDAVGPRR